jgi:magnesium-transporting ATPase (P-type)
MGAAEANVIRDLIVIEEGDTIPADARVIQSTALKMTAAASTGESLAVAKDVATIAGEATLGDRDNMVNWKWGRYMPGDTQAPPELRA